MAGHEGEVVLLNEDNGGDGTDRKQVDALISDERVKQRLRKFTRQLIRRHSLPILHVAKTLMSAGTLQGEEIDSWWQAVRYDHLPRNG